MKKFITSRKVKVIVGAILFAAVFSLGAYARPGIDLTGELISGMFGTKKVAYVAPKSDEEKAIEALMARPGHISFCRDVAEMEYKNKVAMEAVKRFDELAPRVTNKINILNEGGISAETIENTIKIEKAQGRR